MPVICPTCQILLVAFDLRRSDRLECLAKSAMQKARDRLPGAGFLILATLDICR
jgi:hypothetical protein